MTHFELNALIDRAIFTRYAQLLADELSDGTNVGDAPLEKIKSQAESEVTRSISAHVNTITKDFVKVNLKDGRLCFRVTNHDGLRYDVWADNSVQAKMKAMRAGIKVSGVEAT